MQVTRDEFLTRSSFARHKHIDIECREPLNRLEQRARRHALPDDPPESPYILALWQSPVILSAGGSASESTTCRFSEISQADRLIRHAFLHFEAKKGYSVQQCPSDVS
jgi:hypothetical protein